MALPELSKIYKFKIADINLAVATDDSYSRISFVKKSPAVPAFEALHNHALYELFFVGDEPLTVFTEEGATEYRNCFVCIPPLLNHYSIRYDDYRLMFSFQQHGNTHSDFSKFICRSFSSDKPFSGAINDSLTFYIKEFSNLICYQDALANDVATSVLKLIFYNIYISNTKTKALKPQTVNDSYLIKIDAAISDFKKDITLQSVADTLGLSTKQTSRIIRKYYNAPLSELVTKMRLRAACTLLSESDMPVSDIVEYINFPSESYFYSQFKKAYGSTPLKYRKSVNSNAKKRGLNL